jgi:integrase/recombinase XerD
MKWEYWICLYTQTHCTARGLRTTTIAAYQATLAQFRTYIQVRRENKEPDAVAPVDVLDYIRHLREERNNGDAAVNRQVTILKRFYQAMVAMGHLEPAGNPLAQFPRLKARPRKLPVVLSHEEVDKLLQQPDTETILGLRDRAILTLLYATGIRASECASVTEEDVDLLDKTVRVTGKGGHQRVIPLNDSAVDVLAVYRRARGPAQPTAAFFRSRSGKAMTRYAVYERVCKHSRKAGITKRMSPHKLRHTCATHLVKAGVNLVTIRDLLGHRLITSTQIYLHVTAQDLEDAATRHPISRLAPRVADLLPNVKLPFQRPPRRMASG